MKCLAGSILLVSGALMFGAASLAQAIALSANWHDTPVSMCFIGGVFSTLGCALIGWGLLKDRSNDHVMTSGSLAILAGAIVFACGKVAMAVTVLSSTRETPKAMLVIGCIYSLCGVTLLVFGLRSKTFSN